MRAAGRRRRIHARPCPPSRCPGVTRSRPRRRRSPRANARRPPRTSAPVTTDIIETTTSSLAMAPTRPPAWRHRTSSTSATLAPTRSHPHNPPPSSSASTCTTSTPRSPHARRCSCAPCSSRCRPRRYRTRCPPRGSARPNATARGASRVPPNHRAPRATRIASASPSRSSSTNSSGDNDRWKTKKPSSRCIASRKTTKRTTLTSPRTRTYPQGRVPSSPRNG